MRKLAAPVAALLALASMLAACGEEPSGAGSSTQPLERMDPTPHTAEPSESAAGPSPAPTFQPGPSPSIEPESASRASRIVLESLGIDLPVVPGDLQVAGNPPGYPLCDVAQYSPAYRQPGQTGTTYLYAHAQEGMFLPLLEASRSNDGRSLDGVEVIVYTEDGRAHRYEIFSVIRHATDHRIADTVRPGDRRLVLQTSEGPSGTVPKLQVAARHVSSEPDDGDPAPPPAAPRVCG